MEKFPDAYQLVKEYVEVFEPMVLAREDLHRVHLPAYLNSVNTELSSYDRNRLGLPSDTRLLERSILETAGTVSATLTALHQGAAANLAGGTHHAFPDRGLGFCVLNDVAVAIEYLRAHDRKPDQILIVDTDAHQGNANHAFYRAEPSVFTYSIHVGKNYPAKKEPGDMDVPLDRFVSGDGYLQKLTDTLPNAFKQTEPDLVFWISGADTHVDDRFGQMSMTDAQMEKRDKFVIELCRKFHTPTVILYGGGYNKIPGKTGWLHAQSILRAAEEFSI